MSYDPFFEKWGRVGNMGKLNLIDFHQVVDMGKD